MDLLAIPDVIRNDKCKKHNYDNKAKIYVPGMLRTAKLRN